MGELYGKAADEPVSTGCLPHVHPEDRRESPSNGGRPWLYPPPMLNCASKRADGIYRWFHAHAIPVRDQDGHVLKWVGTYTDIHDRKQAQEIQGSAGRHRRIILRCHEKDLDGRILSWNKSAELMFRLPQWRDYQPTDSPHPATGPSCGRIDPHQEIKAGIRIQQFKAYESIKTAIPSRVSLTVSPILDANGQVAAVSTIARDITERKRAEATVNQQRRLIELSYEPIFPGIPERGILDWNRGCGNCMAIHGPKQSAGTVIRFSRVPFLAPRRHSRRIGRHRCLDRRNSSSH